jgi:hypothetical protein
MLSVIVLSALFGVSSMVLRIAHGRLPYGFSFSVGLLLLAVLLYVGHRRVRVVLGLLLLATAIALVFVGLTRAIDLVEAAWIFPVMAVALGYCCWVTLVSRSARRFFERSHGAALARRTPGMLRPRRNRPAHAHPRRPVSPRIAAV